jgi:hypothetical protein
MVIRAYTAALVVVLVTAPAAGAKLNPSFDKHEASVGETVRVSLGEGAEMFVPMRVHLVRTEDLIRVGKQTDPDASLIWAFGLDRNYPVPKAFEFKMPRVRPGDYMLGIWFKASAGGWVNTLDMWSPTITVTGGGSQDGDDSVMGELAAVLVCGLGLALIATAWLHRRGGITAHA